MNRGLKRGVALAVTAVLAGSAGAQGSVTLAGRVDVGPQFINDGTKVHRDIDSGTYTASRLIFRGVEDLGDGLSAGFYMESRFNADTGSQQSAAKLFNAGSTVFLASNTWGSVNFGRQYVPIFWSFLWSDDTGPLRLHGYSAVQSVQRSAFARVRAGVAPIAATGSLDSITGGIYQLNITSAFEDNLVVYKTPKFGGVTAMLAAGAAEGAPSGSGRVLAGNVEYRGGPLYASVAYNAKRGTVPAGGSGSYQTMTEMFAGGMYEVVSNFKLWANVHPWKLESVAASQFKGHDWMVGASYWFPLSELWVNYAAKTLDNCPSCNSRGWGVGYHYFLSKRTELYVSYAQVDNQANSANGLNGFNPGSPGQNVRGFAGGLAVTF